MDQRDIERIFEWDALLDQSSYYELLGLLEIADSVGIRKAFHEFALTFHPDAFPEADDETAEALRRVFQRGAEAYRVLSHPESRSEYDLALATGVIRLEGTLAPPPLAGPSDIRTLNDLCRSAGARRFAKRAEEKISAGDLLGAKRELQMAIHEDGENPELAERLDAIDLALYAMGS